MAQLSITHDIEEINTRARAQRTEVVKFVCHSSLPTVEVVKYDGIRFSEKRVCYYVIYIFVVSKHRIVRNVQQMCKISTDICMRID